jgi:hypothetical protein
LGDDFIGYSPFPEKNQSIEEFEVEELSKLPDLPDGSRLTFAALLKTQFYKDNSDRFRTV